MSALDNGKYAFVQNVRERWKWMFCLMKTAWFDMCRCAIFCRNVSTFENPKIILAICYRTSLGLCLFHTSISIHYLHTFFWLFSVEAFTCCPHGKRHSDLVCSVNTKLSTFFPNRNAAYCWNWLWVGTIKCGKIAYFELFIWSHLN